MAHHPILPPGGLFQGLSVLDAARDRSQTGPAHLPSPLGTPSSSLEKRCFWAPRPSSCTLGDLQWGGHEDRQESPMLRDSLLRQRPAASSLETRASNVHRAICTVAKTKLPFVCGRAPSEGVCAHVSTRVPRGLRPGSLSAAGPFPFPWLRSLDAARC